MIKIFFYGLFMDRFLLTEKGLRPEIIGPAVLPDYRIHNARLADPALGHLSWPRSKNAKPLGELDSGRE